MAYMNARLYTDDVLPHTPVSWQAFAGCFAGGPCALFESRGESPSSVAPAPSTCIWSIRGFLGTGASCELSQTAHTGQHLTDQLWPSSACRQAAACCLVAVVLNDVVACSVFRCGGTLLLSLPPVLRTPPVSLVLHQTTLFSSHMPTVQPCLGHGA